MVKALVSIIVISAWLMYLILVPVRADRNSGIINVYRTALRKKLIYWFGPIIRIRDWFPVDLSIYLPGATEADAEEFTAGLWQYALNNDDFLRDIKVTLHSIADNRIVRITCKILARSQQTARDELKDILYWGTFWGEFWPDYSLPGVEYPEAE